MIALLISLSISSCDQFLNVTPSSSNVNPSTIQDFEELLNADSLATCNYLLADLVTDDVWVATDKRTGPYVNSFLWAQDIWNNNEEDFMYNDSYKRILQLNILLEKVPDIKTTSDSEVSRKNILLAQAKINRAWYYLQLVNIYGEDYSSGTATTSLGVPLILKVDPTQAPERATVEVVYNQILSDLTEALATDELPDMGSTVIHPGKAACLALLARTYLLKGDYENAEKYAKATLEINNTLSDYNTWQTYPLTNFNQKSNPETILARSGGDLNYIYYFNTSFNISREFKSIFNSSDKRLTLLFVEFGGNYVSTNGLITCNYGLGVPEMMLIEAECLARKGNPTEALSLINTLRTNRILTNPTLSVPDEEVLETVFAERRRELFLRGGLRLFDLKRLNRESKFQKKLERFSLNTGGVTDTLVSSIDPNSPRYLMQIAPINIERNKNIVQNPR